jgi:hypothetical protein
MIEIVILAPMQHLIVLSRTNPQIVQITPPSRVVVVGGTPAPGG